MIGKQNPSRKKEPKRVVIFSQWIVHGLMLEGVDMKFLFLTQTEGNGLGHFFKFYVLRNKISLTNFKIFHLNHLKF